MALGGKQRRFLRGLGHHLEPIVMVGKSGVDDGVLAALDRALLDHELVKVKLFADAQGGRHDVAEALAASTGAEIAQVLGYTLLIYRPHPEAPRIKLPARAGAGPGHDDDDDDGED